MFDCFGVRFVPLFLKKSQTFKMAKRAGKIGQTWKIILPFLAKPLDKHGITLVPITYLPLGIFFSISIQKYENIKSYMLLRLCKVEMCWKWQQRTVVS